jgi:hypothetical protein
MSDHTQTSDDPLQLIRELVASVLSGHPKETSDVIVRMTRLVSQEVTGLVTPQLAPEIRHKPTVTKLMDLARQLRQAHPDDYDAKYKQLQNALYAALQQPD